MRSFIVATIASAVYANELFNIDEQELGRAVFDKVASVMAPSENFKRVERELGQPAMHGDLVDGKLQSAMVDLLRSSGTTLIYHIRSAC